MLTQEKYETIGDFLVVPLIQIFLNIENEKIEEFMEKIIKEKNPVTVSQFTSKHSDKIALLLLKCQTELAERNITPKEINAWLNMFTASIVNDKKQLKIIMNSIEQSWDNLCEKINKNLEQNKNRTITHINTSIH